MRKLALTVATIGLILTSISGDHRAENNPGRRIFLASAPAPISAGAGIAAVMGLVGAPLDSVFALRGGGTTDFWHYSISQNEWANLPDTPAPVGDGGGIVEVFSFDLCQPGRFFIGAIRGSNTTDFWQFNIDENTWWTGPSTPAPVGPGGAIAQLQRIGQIYVLRGNGTTDFWSLKNRQWTMLANTPGPINVGGGLVGINYGTRSQRDVLYAVQGGGSRAVWKYDVDTNTWTHQSDAPAPIGPGGAITSPNFGDEGTLNILQGGMSPAVWSLDISADSWNLIDDAPSGVAAGGATSNQFNGCDFAFVGGGSTQFFSTGLRLCVADAASFSLSFDQPTITAPRGTKVKVKLNVVRTGGFTGNVNVIPPATPPAGIKVPDGTISVTGDSVSFKVKVKDSAASGVDELTFTGMDATGRKRTTTLTLIVQ